jgi:type II secretory pathway component PulM
MIRNLTTLNSLLKDFHFRQRFMSIILAVLAVFFVFYITFAIFEQTIQASTMRSQQLQERVAGVKTSIAKIERNTSQTKILSTGLLTYVQNLNGQLSGTGKFTNIRVVNNTLRQEQVSFKTENLVYNDFVKILKEFESYANLQIKSISVNKRFDNPKRIDALWDLVRLEQ